MINAMVNVVSCYVCEKDLDDKYTHRYMLLFKAYIVPHIVLMN